MQNCNCNTSSEHGHLDAIELLPDSDWNTLATHSLYLPALVTTFIFSYNVLHRREMKARVNHMQ